VTGPSSVDVGVMVVPGTMDETVPMLDVEEVEPSDAFLEVAPLDTTLEAASSRAASLWNTARVWLNDYRSPIKRRTRALSQGAVEATQPLVATALQFKASTTEAADLLKQATVANALKIKSATAGAAEVTQPLVATALQFKASTTEAADLLKQATVANALKIKSATAEAAFDLSQTATVNAGVTTNRFNRGLVDVTNKVATHKQWLAEAPAAQKATQLLGDARAAGASVISKVREAEVVRTVSSGAADISSSIREFANIQRY